MKTILVTGGGGFIGSNLVAALLKRGTYHIVVCDTFGSDDKWRNLSKHIVFEIIHPDRMFEWIEFNKVHIEMIYHIGGISSTVENDVDTLLRRNFDFSLRLWRWCNSRGVRLVYTSSSATYGNGEHGFDDTTDLAYLRSLKSLSAYGWIKHIFDMHVAGALERGEVSLPQWVGLKLFNTYGPNEYHKGEQRSMISKMAPSVLEGASVRLFRSYHPQYRDGEQKRDMIYVKDCVSVMLWLLDNPRVNGMFNLGSGKASTFREMAEALYESVNRKPNITYIDMPDALVKNYQYFTEANMQKLRVEGYKQDFMSLKDGIQDYVQNYLLAKDIYR
ncbi:MAG: ADP-glyceromanno-heptose 6-epimerase [Alphaproteobacteria bacterium]